ncbi:abortive infection family protein [Mucilaginibacter sp.]|uniref:abortive infection family protein n=1 Tax=Mucilaginibacter sp. TaxID=1882438 RepID=UPI0026086D13|nr:abortive infection family protein [Mucilaginibacter sp.]MDB4920645.1 hypothetical protein [Mucilaginibacter sp.]
MDWIRSKLSTMPSFAPLLDQVEVIDNYVISNPTLCVETCKSLIEGICKTILSNKNISYSNDAVFNSLVKQTIDAILNPEESFRNDLVELGRRIASVSQKLGEIRNNTGFVSHGMDVLNPRLTETISYFSYKITDTIGGFILNCYINNRISNADNRIHYDDNQNFNEYFDEINPMSIGPITLSASKILFQEDYQAYKEAQFDYLSTLDDDE